MEIKLIATTGRARGQAVDVKTAKFFIGRHENCQLRPDIPGLAGIHALVEDRENRLYLRDFGAEGGTGLNDRVLHARESEVFDGDLIQVGPMVLTLSVKTRGEGPRHSLLHAPDGWPYLEGNDHEPAPPLASMQPGAPPSRVAPPPLAPLAPVASFLTLHPSIHPDRGSAGSLATSATAVAAPPKPAPQFQPILTKTLGHRAIDCKMVEGVMVVSLLSPDLKEEETVSPVRYELRGLLEDEKVPGRMVIDMGQTRYLSSRAVGVLLAHYQGLERIGSTMRVCGVSPEIKPVLDQMRLSMLIDIYPSVEEAVNDPWE